MGNMVISTKQPRGEAYNRRVLTLMDKCLKRQASRTKCCLPVLRHFRHLADHVESGHFQRPLTQAEFIEETVRQMGMRRVGDNYVFENGKEAQSDLLDRLEVRPKPQLEDRA
jgi:hypothetical protein